MVNERRIYLLDPQKYSPETIAVAFAKTSRSPESFQQIASELNEAKSAEFNEKWVVGYGHSSVAEHAVLHIAVENISRLACECLESNRLASYTEKSTRYQTWDAQAFYIPEEINSSPVLPDYVETCKKLLSTYQSIIPPVVQQLAQDNAQLPYEKSSTWERRIRSLAIDNCRFVLPSAALANVGMTANARTLEHALVKMLSHPLAEVRRIGSEIKACSIQSIPTLLKYAEPDEYLGAVCVPSQFTDLPAPSLDTEWCRLIQFDPDTENRILAAYLYRTQSISYTHALAWVQRAPAAEKVLLAKNLLDMPNLHSAPLRELEHANFTFDVIVDQGAFYEVKRHRMMTLTPQNLTTHLGYALPKAIVSAGQSELFCAAMAQARLIYGRLEADFPYAAAYVVPNAFNRRFLITTNLRSMFHFIQLRSAANAHFSVRRLAQQFACEIRKVLPSFSSYIPLNLSEWTELVEANYFSETMKM